MKMAAIFLLVVGCVWALFVVWLFLSISGVASTPDSILRTVLFWGGMLVGPLILIVGSVLSLRGVLRPGAGLVAVGCVLLTILAIYNSVEGMQRKPLEAPPLYAFYIALLIIMLLADVAGYKVVRAAGGLR
jgi:hypothetical protein